MKKYPLLTGLLLFAVALPLPAKEFLNTFLHINLGVTWTAGNFGEVIDRELATELSTEKSDTFGYGEPSFLHTSFDFSLDLAPFRPLVLGYEAHAVKIGLRGGMRMHSCREILEVTANGSESTYSGNMMTYYAVSYTHLRAHET